MFGRTRRVRLLAVVVCIVTVFVLYERAEIHVDRYAGYLGGGVGGGAVMRPSEQQQQQQKPQPDPPRPEPVNEVLPRPLRTAQPPQPLAAELTTTTTAIAATDLPRPPVEISGQGRIEEPAIGDEAILRSSTSQHPPIHWTKQPERFPVASTIQLPSGEPSAVPLIQKSGPARADEERLAAVQEACQHAWKGFHDDGGWGYDEVKPLAGGGQNSFNGWGATLVDSLDTLWIMGMKAEFEEAVRKAAAIDFTTSSRNDIPLFEVTIRYLGGLIAAYDVSGRTYTVLLDKAVELAEILYSAFDTPNRMPETYYYWKPTYASQPHRASKRAVMAELGTLSMEFTRLAQLTGEPKYYDAIARVTDAFEESQNSTRVPGMWPTNLDASGCQAPVQRPAPVHQFPIFNGDSAMVAGEPVQAQRTVEGVAGASRPLPDSTVRHSDDPRDQPVKNPLPANLAGAGSDATMRHVMDDHLAIAAGPRPSGVERTGSGFAQNPPDAKAPLPPPAPGDNAVKEQAAGTRPYGAAEGEPLPPAKHSKRELASSEAGSHGLQRRQLSFDPSSKDNDDDDCVPQGLASVSRNAPETFTLGGASDSTYEYLPKMFLLLGGRVEQYRNMYLASMAPVIDKLLFRPMNEEGRDILISGELRVSVNVTTREIVEKHEATNQHLTCFAGGMFALGGRIFNIPEHVDLGSRLTDGCVWSYNVTRSGIMPESYALVACDSRETCPWNETRWHEELDPQAAFRDDWRIEWQEDYQVEDIVAYEQALAAASSASVLAATATKTAAPVDGIGFHGPQGAVYPGVDDTKLRKRQLDVVGEAGDDTATTPTKASLAAPNVHRQPDAYRADVLSPATSTTSTRPIHTPAPPLTHDAYVQRKIHSERLPPGFTRIDGRAYILRPEAIESVFYLYRITRDPYWREVGWHMFRAVERATRAPHGHASVDDVTRPHPRQADKMESFWIAETLKYFYLLFDDPNTWSLDDWVFNTEAHLFRRPHNPQSSV